MLVELKATVLVKMTCVTSITSTCQGRRYTHPLYSSFVLTFLEEIKILVHSFSFRPFSFFCGTRTFFVDEDPFSHYPGWHFASSSLSFSFIKSTLCWLQESLDKVPSMIPVQHPYFSIFDSAVSGVKNLFSRVVHWEVVIGVDLIPCLKRFTTTI